MRSGIAALSGKLAMFGRELKLKDCKVRGMFSAGYAQTRRVGGRHQQAAGQFTRACAAQELGRGMLKKDRPQKYQPCPDQGRFSSTTS